MKLPVNLRPRIHGGAFNILNPCIIRPRQPMAPLKKKKRFRPCRRQRAGLRKTANQHLSTGLFGLYDRAMSGKTKLWVCSCRPKRNNIVVAKEQTKRRARRADTITESEKTLSPPPKTNRPFSTGHGNMPTEKKKVRRARADAQLCSPAKKKKRLGAAVLLQ